MSFNYKKIFALLIIAAVFSAAAARAADNGQEDLDKATELKLSATTVTDWGEVIRLTESALQKGLDKSNTEFANKLMASTLVQRAMVVTATIQKNLPHRSALGKFQTVCPVRPGESRSNWNPSNRRR